MNGLKRVLERRICEVGKLILKGHRIREWRLTLILILMLEFLLTAKFNYLFIHEVWVVNIQTTSFLNSVNL